MHDKRIALIYQYFKHTVLSDCAKTQKRLGIFIKAMNIRRNNEYTKKKYE